MNKAHYLYIFSKGLPGRDKDDKEIPDYKTQDDIEKANEVILFDDKSGDSEDTNGKHLLDKSLNEEKTNKGKKKKTSKAAVKDFWNEIWNLED